MAKRIAVVVGINSYPAHHTPLRLCVDDAETVATILEIDSYGFDVTLVLNEKATKAGITQAIVEAREAEPQMLVFFFAGHGMVDATGAFLVCADAAPYDEGIEMRRLVSLVSGGLPPTSEVLVLLDCCEAGAAQLPGTASRAPITDSFVEPFRHAANGNKAILGAARENESAEEDMNLGHGIFTYHLQDALLGQAANHNGKITINSLYSYISSKLNESVTQVPFFHAALAGDTVLCSGLTPALAPPPEQDEYERIETTAAQLVQQHRVRRLDPEWADWQSVGFRAAAQDLGHKIRWFDKEISRIPTLTNRPRFSQAWAEVRQFRSNLGSLTADTHTPIGTARELLGQGSFGSVWKFDLESGTTVAYKVFHPNDLGNTVKSSRFRRGFDAMSALDHPRIVRVQTYTEAPLGFTMEFIDGSNLRDLAPAASWEPSDILKMLIEVAEAISHAHERQIVHRDIKPENIICRYDAIARQWTPFLTDFDLAWINTATQVTHEGIGSFLYSAPEQFMNFAPTAVNNFRPTLDVYGFGQVAFYCITGSDPSPIDYDENIHNFERRIGSWPSSVAAEAALDFYSAATRTKPSERTVSMTEVVDQLRTIQKALVPGARSVSTTGAFLRELEFAFTGRIISPSDHEPSVEFPSTSQQTTVLVEAKPETDNKMRLNITLTPRERVSMSGISNDSMRNRLNNRIAAIVDPIENAQWQPGRAGAYQVRINLLSVERSDDGFASARKTLSDVLTKLESSLAG